MSRGSSLVVNQQIAIPRNELRFSYVRSSGPGGQNVNKVNTKAVLHWNVEENASLPDDVRERLIARFSQRINNAGELVLASQRYRDQARNVRDCLDKLRELILTVAYRPVARKKYGRPWWANEARLRQKKLGSAKKKARRPPAQED